MINDISRNVFSSGNLNQYNKVNSMKTMIMQSQRNLERVIPDFEAAIAAGYNPNDVKDSIFKKYNLTDNDFTGSDVNILIRKVEEIYKIHNTRRF